MSSRTFQLGGQIELVEQYKYLGVVIDSHMDLTPALENISAAASRALGSVIGKTRDHFELSHSPYSRLFKSCIVPILDYSSGAWAVGGNYSKLDRIQNRCVRFFCGLPKTTSTLALVGDMGWMPGVVRRDLETLRMYNQLVKMNNTRLTRRIFEADVERDGDWSKNLIALLCSLDKYEHFCSRSVVNVETAKGKLIAMYESEWRNQISLKPKL